MNFHSVNPPFFFPPFCAILISENKSTIKIFISTLVLSRISRTLKCKQFK